MFPLNHFLSFVCPACRKGSVEAPGAFCPDCLSRLPIVGNPSCPACGGELDGILNHCSTCLKVKDRPWSKAVAVMKFERFGRRVVHDFKYRDHPELAVPLGHLAADAARRRNVEADIVVPMPLHWTRLWTRGFNQSELLAETVSRRFALPIEKPLSRTRRTRRQANLNRRDRKINIKNAFSVTRRDICLDRVILLVDDVLTTGSTLTAASSALLEAGAAKVNVLVIARGL